MDVVDAICRICGKPIRWQPVTPRKCAECKQIKNKEV